MTCRSAPLVIAAQHAISVQLEPRVPLLLPSEATALHCCLLRSPSACLVAACSGFHWTTGQMRRLWSGARPSQHGRCEILIAPFLLHLCPWLQQVQGHQGLTVWSLHAVQRNAADVSALVADLAMKPIRCSFRSCVKRCSFTCPVSMRVTQAPCLSWLHAGVAGCEGADAAGPAQNSQEAQVW